MTKIASIANRLTKLSNKSLLHVHRLVLTEAGKRGAEMLPQMLHDTSVKLEQDLATRGKLVPIPPECFCNKLAGLQDVESQYGNTTFSECLCYNNVTDYKYAEHLYRKAVRNMENVVVSVDDDLTIMSIMHARCYSK